MSLENLPKETAGDNLHKVVRSALGAIPFAGTGAIELFNSVIVPPLVKRRDEWLNNLVKELEKLVSQIEGFKIENLQDNEEFISALIHATSVAIKTHQQDKITMLRNIVLNSALSPLRTESNTDEYSYYLNILEDITLKEFQALVMLEKYQTATPRGLSQSSIVAEGLIPDNDLEWATRFWNNYEQELSSELYIPQTELRGFIERLSRTGCFVLITGAYFGYEGGMGLLTDLYYKLKDLVTLNI